MEGCECSFTSRKRLLSSDLSHRSHNLLVTAGEMQAERGTEAGCPQDPCLRFKEGGEVHWVFSLQTGAGKWRPKVSSCLKCWLGDKLARL